MDSRGWFSGDPCETLGVFFLFFANIKHQLHPTKDSRNTWTFPFLAVHHSRLACACPHMATKIEARGSAAAGEVLSLLMAYVYTMWLRCMQSGAIGYVRHKNMLHRVKKILYIVHWFCINHSIPFGFVVSSSKVRIKHLISYPLQDWKNHHLPNLVIGKANKVLVSFFLSTGLFDTFAIFSYFQFHTLNLNSCEQKHNEPAPTSANGTNLLIVVHWKLPTNSSYHVSKQQHMDEYAWLGV